jgi:hypothetical protein
MDSPLTGKEWMTPGWEWMQTSVRFVGLFAKGFEFPTPIVDHPSGLGSSEMLTMLTYILLRSLGLEGSSLA